LLGKAYVISLVLLLVTFKKMLFLYIIFVSSLVTLDS